jgi:hypothetical protein
MNNFHLGAACQEFLDEYFSRLRDSRGSVKRIDLIDTRQAVDYEIIDPNS